MYTAGSGEAALLLYTWRNFESTIYHTPVPLQQKGWARGY